MDNMHYKKLPCLAIIGPTGVGKTALALALAQKFPIEIINMDSVQVYQDLNIGSAKPEPDILAQVPHHLIDVCSPTDYYSVSHFLMGCQAAIESIASRQHIPVIVGGTMMYYHALLYGLHTEWPRSIEIRQKIQEDAQKNGWTYLYEFLERIDPTSAQKIYSTDHRRIERALEIYYLSGQRPSHFRHQQKITSRPALTVILTMNRREKERVEERLIQRIRAMFQQGWLDEMRTLIKRYPGLEATHPSMKSVGYRECFEFLHTPHQDQQTLINHILISTRQLVKKQDTWLKKLPSDREHDIFSQDVASLFSWLCDHVERQLFNIPNMRA